MVDLGVSNLLGHLGSILCETAGAKGRRTSCGNHVAAPFQFIFARTLASFVHRVTDMDKVIGAKQF